MPFKRVKKVVGKAAEGVASAVTADIEYYDFEDLSPSSFEIRNGNRVTLFQDAHCEGDYPPQIIMDNGQLNYNYVPGNCFEEIYKALLNAKRFIYITGWSVDTKISLVRRKPIFEEEDSNDSPPAGKMTIGELLKYKASQGVRVLLHVWDEALSVNIAGFTTAGVMATFDEETKKYFSGTGVECKLSYRTGSKKDNQFLWTHHQKSVIVDAKPVDGSLHSAVQKEANVPAYMSGLSASSLAIERLTLNENDYGRPDKDGNRFAIAAFMTCEHNFKRMWDDNGSWCQPHSVTIFRPDPPPGWFILGDIAQRGIIKDPNTLTKVMVVKEPPPVPGYPPILAPPQTYVQTWPLKEGKVFSSKSGDVMFWKPIPPEGYQALGYVITRTPTMPSVDLIRCVHNDAVEQAHPSYEEDHLPIWKNKGKVRSSLGGPEMSLWMITPSRSGVVSGTFCVRGGHKLPQMYEDTGDYWCLKDTPIGIEVCPKPGDSDITTSQSFHSLPTKKPDIIGKRRIIAFVGGLDLTYGRWDTPNHPLYKTLDAEHISDFLHGWALNPIFGPREPWHDIHSKLEGPIARDVLTNFEQRWRRQGKTPLEHIGKDFISIQEEEFSGGDTWSCRLARSIDPFSADIPGIDNSIQHSYVQAIRKAKRFIYLENQYFMGSSKHWIEDRDTGCVNLIPYEIATRIAQSIKTDYCPMIAYILIPLYPEGFPLDAAIQEQLRWQWNTICMMYQIVHEAILIKGMHRNPMEFLKFLAVGQREDESLSRASKKNPQKGSREFILSQTRRVPIYVHSKLMIIDDEYLILGSANINERSMSGDRDSEICVECWQPAFTNVGRARGGIHQFRMSLWAEHTGESAIEFLEPNTPACSAKISYIAEKNWQIFAGDTIMCMNSHLMRYPIRVSDEGKVVEDPSHFPDTKAKVRGQSSLTMPDLLTC